MKNDFDGLSSRLDTTEERISELEDTSEVASKTEKQGEQRPKKSRISSYKRCNICVMGIPEGEVETGAEEIFEIIMIENFSKLMQTLNHI